MRKAPPLVIEQQALPWLKAIVLLFTLAHPLLQTSGCGSTSTSCGMCQAALMCGWRYVMLTLPCLQQA